MFSLQVQIRNLTPAASSPTLHSLPLNNQPITIRFGPLQTDLQLTPSPQQPTSYSAGKKLLLQLEKPEMTNLMKNYAFGLFMQNEGGRFWCVLSLERIGIGEQYDAGGVRFCDDERKVGYVFGVGVRVLGYKPRMPKKVKYQEQYEEFEEQENQMMATTNKLNLNHKQSQKQGNNIKSFLYGKKNNYVKQNLIPPQPVTQKLHPQTACTTKKTPPNKNQPAPQNTHNHFYNQAMKGNFTGRDSDQQTGIYTPPVMQFTNNQHLPQQRSYNYINYNKQTISIQNRIPRRQGRQQQYYQYQINLNNTDVNMNSKVMPKNMPKFQTFMDYSQFREFNKQSTQNPTDKPPNPKHPQKPTPTPTQTFNKQKTKQLAHLHAQQQASKKTSQVMIPIPNPRTGAYQLVPISKMSEGQLIEYAEKQRLAQEYEERMRVERARLERKEERKEERRRRREQHIGTVSKDMLNKVKNVNIGMVNQRQKISQKVKQSSSDSQQHQQSKQSYVRLQYTQNPTQNPKKPQQKPPAKQASRKQSSNLTSNLDNSQQNSQSMSELQYQERSRDRKESDDYEKDSEQEEEQKEEQGEQYSDNYEEDFQSLSGSMMKSRKSLQSSISMSQDRQKLKQKQKQRQKQRQLQKQRQSQRQLINQKYLQNLKQHELQKQKKQNKDSQYDISQSLIDEYGYSQDFDSFSQSVLSKREGGRDGGKDREKGRDKGSSISELSDYSYMLSNRK